MIGLTLGVLGFLLAVAVTAYLYQLRRDRKKMRQLQELALDLRRGEAKRSLPARSFPRPNPRASDPEQTTVYQPAPPFELPEPDLSLGSHAHPAPHAPAPAHGHFEGGGGHSGGAGASGSWGGDSGDSSHSSHGLHDHGSSSSYDSGSSSSYDSGSSGGDSGGGGHHD